MAVRGDTLVVPTIGQARAAADALAEEGVSAVLLYGSVAAGTAREGSDIDVVAVFDDIDYAERYPRRWRLEAKCAAAAGVPVDVHVTDWPEWRRRTAEVSSSFEASVAARQQLLFEREPRPDAVRWGKEIGMPDSNLGEAVERLADMCQSLAEMTAACRLRDGETPTHEGDEQVVALARAMRLRSLCAAASMTIENALKAWWAASGIASERTHSVARLVERAGALPGALVDALAPLEANTMRPSREAYDDVSSWRIGGAYPSALPQATSDKTEHLVRLLAPAAVTAADVTLRRLLDEGADTADERVAVCAAQVRIARAALAARDPVTGRPLDGVSPSPAVGRRSTAH
ncbi:nucleotidyltransferase domain-containing protein [Candidatus Poriferisodalis sp.]|uniref:nucleotidyltransferase domain-containing protein n=1 Tax=Candidatus Poriferisodalis sp. TaxID=3101277 RepID=UPI003B01B341